MSNHFSADNLKFPGDDRRLDITDVFVFQARSRPRAAARHHPAGADHGLEPDRAPPPHPGPVTGPEFYPDAVYRINIDTDGDAHADVAFTFIFSELRGRQADRDRLVRHRRPGPPARAGRRTAHRLPPGQLRRHRPARPGRPDPAVRRAAQRPVLRRRRGRPARLPVDRARRLRRQQRRLHRAGGTRRHARRRPADRRLGLDQPAPRRRHPGADGPRREPDHQPVHQPRRREEPLQLPPARRRRRQLPRAVVQDPGKRRRLPPRGRPRRPPCRCCPTSCTTTAPSPPPTPTAASSPTTSTAYRFAWLSNGKIPPHGLKPHDDLLHRLPLPRPAQPQP